MINRIHQIKIRIKLESGMHISGSNDSYDIGGTDAQVVKNPLSGEPYIPGSSIKGKLRSLLEYKYGNFSVNEKNKEIKLELQDDDFCKLFEPRDDLIPNITRGIFRDAVLTQESKEKLESVLGKHIYTEIKAENSIGRFNTREANPRFIERVPAGSEFEGEIDIIEFDGDDYKKMYKHLEDAIELLNLNYIGGSGSRGYGKVNVVIVNKPNADESVDKKEDEGENID